MGCQADAEKGAQPQWEGWSVWHGIVGAAGWTRARMRHLSFAGSAGILSGRAGIGRRGVCTAQPCSDAHTSAPPNSLVRGQASHEISEKDQEVHSFRGKHPHLFALSQVRDFYEIARDAMVMHNARGLLLRHLGCCRCRSRATNMIFMKSQGSKPPPGKALTVRGSATFCVSDPTSSGSKDDTMKDYTFPVSLSLCPSARCLDMPAF